MSRKHTSKAQAWYGKNPRQSYVFLFSKDKKKKGKPMTPIGYSYQHLFPPSHTVLEL
jgi:hypothetical protein